MSTQTESKDLLRTKNRAEEDLAGLSGYQQNTITALLRTFMMHLRKRHDHATKILDAKKPERLRCCDSCAFVPETDDWKGFVPTAYGFAWAIHNQKPFLCHRNQPQWRENIWDRNIKPELCRSYVEARACYPESLKQIAQLTLEAIEKVKLGPREPPQRKEENVSHTKSR